MNFFKGRYGLDLLSLFLLVLGIILNIFDFTRIFAVALMFLVIFRLLSKNTYARRSESDKFNYYLDKLLRKFGLSLPYYLKDFTPMNLYTLYNNMKSFTEEKKLYKITKCPKCKQKLRLPRGKGSIVVTCKKCNNKFDLKT